MEVSNMSQNTTPFPDRWWESTETREFIEALNRSGVLMFFFVLLSSAILSELIRHLPRSVRPQSSIVLFLFGFLLGHIPTWVDAHTRENNSFIIGLQYFGFASSDIINYGFLPIAIYESASQLNFFAFKKIFSAAFILALPGVIFSGALVGVFLRYYLGTSWIFALTVAFALGATDPVAVISSLNEVRAPERLAALIDGESLLNDGSGYVLFEVCKEGLAGHAFSVGDAFLTFVVIAGGAVVFGVAMGIAVRYLTSLLTETSILQNLLVTTSAYFTYYCADAFLGISGVLSTVAFGLYVGACKNKVLTRKAQEVHHSFVSILATLSVQCIFVIGGIVTPSLTVATSNQSIGSVYLNAFLTYLMLQLTRALTLAVFAWPIKLVGTKLSFKEYVVVFWSGIRGIISITCALSLAHPSYPLAADLRSNAVHIILIATFFGLIVNGLSIQCVYKALNLYPVGPFRIGFFKKVMGHAEEEYQRRVSSNLLSHWLFGNSALLHVMDGVVPNLTRAVLNQNGWIDLKKESPSQVLSPFLISKDAIDKEARPTFDDTEHRFRRLVSPGLGSQPLRSGVAPRAEAWVRHLVVTGSLGDLYPKSASHFKLQRKGAMGSSRPEEIDRELHLSTLIIGGYLHLYETMYHAHGISGSALESLRTSVDVAMAHGEKLVELSKGSCFDRSMHTSMLRVNWEAARGEVWRRQRWAIRLRFLRCLSFNYEWQTLKPCIQIVVAYIEGHLRFKRTVGADLRHLLPTALLKDFDDGITEAVRVLQQLHATFPLLYPFAITMLASHSLINQKEAVLEEHWRRGDLLSADFENLISIFQSQRRAISLFVPTQDVCLYWSCGLKQRLPKARGRRYSVSTMDEWSHMAAMALDDFQEAKPPADSEEGAPEALEELEENAASISVEKLEEEAIDQPPPQEQMPQLPGNSSATKT
eukprot:GHVT01002866.1.p1 GENE.GHVT01002866.1~~GHVT01002866.1.p1  ORF type:complete len:930 (-),score=141.77 GHVT01002866.1:743-3532(-)